MKIILSKIVKNQKGTITHFLVHDNNKCLNYKKTFLAKKSDLINMIRNINPDIEIRTIYNDEVRMMGTYFKIVGNKNADINSLSLYKFSLIEKIINFLKKIWHKL